MKLVLKRIGKEQQELHPVVGLFESALGKSEKAIDARPFALHTEDGEVLPCQVSTTMSSEPGGPVTVTVVFVVDGHRVSVEGP